MEAARGDMSHYNRNTQRHILQSEVINPTFVCFPNFSEHYHPHTTANVISRPTFCSRSFKPLNSGFVRDIFNSLYEELPWQPFNNIQTCWLTTWTCNCQYMHSSRKFPATVFTPTIQNLGEQIASIVGHANGFNSCNANLYVNGKHALGMHADGEYLFGRLDEPNLLSASV